MASLTSQQTGVLAASETGQQDWPVFVCRQGVFLFDPRSYFPVDPSEVFVQYQDIVADPARGFVALPDCRVRDALLDQPPLGLYFSQAEAQNLIADTTGSSNVLAATDFGSPSQDKPSNQDFALAASIRVQRPGGVASAFQFAAIADGVTTRTLWPERSARIAALSAWRVARRHLEADRGFSHQAFDKFREALVSSIRSDLEADMAMLLSSDQEIVPPGWAADTYRHFKKNRDLWYNSTLLVTLVGPDAGFVMTCGDGGVVVRKTEGGETKSVVVVRSTDEVSVSGVVSLAADAMRFRQTRISLTPDTRLEVVMSTDGVDRSLRREQGMDDSDMDPYGNDFSYCSSSKFLSMKMTERLSQIADREIDNISIAILKSPLGALPVLAEPSYHGAIVAAGETVEDINLKSQNCRKASELKRFGAAENSAGTGRATNSGGADADSHVGPISRSTRNRLPSGPSFPSDTRVDKTIAPTIWNTGKTYGSGGSHPAPARRSRNTSVRLEDLDRACAAAVWASDKLMDIEAFHQDPSSEKLLGIMQRGRHASNSRFSTAAFSKVLFCVFAVEYSDSFSRDRGDNDEIEPRIDQTILASCRRLGHPTATQIFLPIREIDTSESFDVVQSFIRILRTGGLSTSQIERLKKAFELL
jgi:Protein phosphatase 2C